MEHEISIAQSGKPSQGGEVGHVGVTTLESYAVGIAQKLQLCDLILKSGLCPASFNTKEAIFSAILYGQELGFSPFRSLSIISVIKGKPTLDASGIKALMIQNGGMTRTLEWDEKICTLECTRGNWKETLSYSIQDAERAGLLNKDNWKNYPKEMLYARCVSRLGRNMFADILGGLQSRQEIEDAEFVEILAEKKERAEQAVFYYDLSLIEDAEKRASAILFVKNQKCTKNINGNENHFESSERIKRLDKYQVVGLNNQKTIFEQKEAI